MSFLTKIKNALKQSEERKPICSISKLAMKKRFPVVKASRCTTRFGEQISVELQDCVVYLPKRLVTRLDDEDVEQLKNCSLEVLGPCGQTFNIDFHEKEEQRQEQQQQQQHPTQENIGDEPDVSGGMYFLNSQKRLFYNQFQ